MQPERLVTFKRGLKDCLAFVTALCHAAGKIKEADDYLLELLAVCAFRDHNWEPDSPFNEKEEVILA